MYKRIYKKACEEIKGDRDAILNKAFERAAEPEKKKSPILKYSVIGTAAAAVIVAGAVILNWDVIKIPLDDIVSEDSAEIIEESQSEAASGETAETEADEAVTAAEAETEKAVQTAVVTEETAAETEPAAKVTPKTQETAEVTEEEAVMFEDSAEEAADAETATEFGLSRGRSMITETEDMDENVDEDAGGEVTGSLTSASSTAGTAGGESAKTEVVAVSEDDDCDYEEDYDDDFSGSTMMLTTGWSGADVNVEALTYEEYADYLGFDVREIELPIGMSFDWIEESVYEIYTDEEGNVSDDTALFTASGEEKSITIITTRLIALDEEFEAYENVAANVARNGDYAIYAVKNEAYITIEFDNVESAEIDAIAEQLAE